MTIAMPDSIYADHLPPGYPAYLGYVDGDWPTAPELERLFPAAQLVRLTVTGATLEADGIDCEPGNVNAGETAAWVARKLAADPHFRPVVYASVQGQVDHGMPWVMSQLAAHGIRRAQIRLLTAHYGAGSHICGPATCKLLGQPADGTQWTNSYSTGSNAVIDMSALQDNFFGSPAQTATEKIVQELGTVGVGETGEIVRTVQGLCVARGALITVDGKYGVQTHSAVQAVQRAGHIFPDGIVGPQTWPVLLGVA
jgi:hypothetical protein